ncbi:MAG: carboxypeptidase-like regulatory domain-containing protein [Nitrospirales bacterium]
MRHLIFLALVVTVSLGSPTWAYEETAVSNGGTIAGTVTLAGNKPSPKAFNLVTFPDPVYCGRISTGTGWRLLHEFVVGPGNGLKDVVVMLVDIEKGKPFTFEPPTIEARDCRFLPFVTTVRDKHDVVVINMDPVMHDIQAYETSNLGPRVLFNTPLPMNPHHPRNIGANTHNHLPGKPMVENITLTKNRRIFVMQCGFHAYMEAWGIAVDNPYYVLTRADGTFELTDVPPGEYTLAAWHPQAGSILEQRVRVTANGRVTADFKVHPPRGRRSGHEMVENPHFGIEALGKSVEIIPTKELQKP